jgi:hypothetical protein
LAVVISLLRWRPSTSPLSPGDRRGDGGEGTGCAASFTIRRPIAVLVIWSLVGVPAACAMGIRTPSTLTEDGFIVGDSNLVILEPQRWVGSRFPLLAYIEGSAESLKRERPLLRERLANGDWLVVLYRRGCPKCHEILNRYRRNVEQYGRGGKQGMSVAVIELPPVGQATMLDWCETGRLGGGYHWFLKTPMAIRLRNGIVELGGDDISDMDAEPLPQQIDDPSA